MSKQQEIPDEAVEAAANAWMDRASRPGSWALEDSCRAALEAALPYILAPVLSLADEMDSVHGSIRGHVTTYQLRQALGVDGA